MYNILRSIKKNDRKKQNQINYNYETKESEMNKDEKELKTKYDRERVIKKKGKVKNILQIDIKYYRF